MNLSAKLNTMFALFVVAISGCVIYIFFTLWSGSLRLMIQNRQLEAAQEAMNKIDRILYERYMDIKQVASETQTIQILLGKSSLDVDHIASEVTALSRSSGPWNVMRYIGSDGRIFASSKKDEIGTQLFDKVAEPFYQQALLGSEVYSDAITDSDGQLSVLFASPVKNGDVIGKPVIGVVMGHFSWRIVQEIVENIGSYRVNIINAEGLGIGTNNKSVPPADVLPSYKDASSVKAARENVSGNVFLPDLESGAQALVSYIHEPGYLDFKGNNWILFLQTPISEVNAAMIPTIIPAALLFVLIVVVGSIVFMVMLRTSIIRPIKYLTEVVTKRSAGDVSARMNISSKDEVGLLASAFNVMASTVQSSYESLEQKVREKTEELQGQVSQFEVQNRRLEENKVAMVNLLEDSKELEDQLKIEKAGVESKVVERTLELKEEQARLIASIGSLSIGFILADPDDKVILKNESVARIIGLKNAEVSIEAIHEKLKGAVDLKELCRKVQKDGRPVDMKSVSLEHKYLRLQVAPVTLFRERNEAIGYVLLVDDITEAKLLERSRDEFFSIASHELRTPLTAIRGNMSMILEYYSEKLSDPEFKEMIVDVHQSSIRLINIVNDFLQTSRLEQGRLTFKYEAFDVASLISDVLKEYEVTGSRKKLSLTYVPPDKSMPQAWADKDRVKEVLINLVGNALKFTEEGGVTVRVQLSDDYIRVVVEDTGRGIPYDNQLLLFRKFQQAGDSLFTRDTTKGTGLGLYISKLMIEGMGGTIGLQYSQPGKGSAFGFALPIVGGKYAKNESKPTVAQGAL